MIKPSILFPSLALALGSATAGAADVSGDAVKIGVISDMSSAYADIGGKGTVAAAQMAIKDFGGEVLGKPISLFNIDHQNKVEIAAAKAREWFDQEGVDMVIGLGNTAVHNAVANVANEKKKVVVNTEAGSSAITGENCSPNVVHWTYDTYALANSTGKAVVDHGGKSWFVIEVDYAFGRSLTADVTAAVNKYGGKIIGNVKHPLNTTDFSSQMLTAQGSGAEVIALSNGVNDTINAIKTASQFNIMANQKVAAMMMFITDVHALGLDTAQGMFATTGFYWDLNEDTRTWSERYFEVTGRMPTMAQAGTYSAVRHYLNAVKEAGTDSTEAVMAAMKKTPVNDFFSKGGVIREDGRMVHDMYLIQVKKPSESKRPWDYYNVLSTIPGDVAFRPMDQGGCPLVKKS